MEVNIIALVIFDPSCSLMKSDAHCCQRWVMIGRSLLPVVGGDRTLIVASVVGDHRTLIVASGVR